MKAKIIRILHCLIVFSSLLSASVAAQGLNVNEDNIVKIKVPGIQSSELIVEAEGGTIVRKGEDKWIAHPNEMEKDFIITVSINKNEKKEVLAYKIYKVVDNNIYSSVEEMPSFPGGENAMRDFINRNLKYPKAALDNGIQGRVFISLTIEKDGKISNVKVVKSVGGGLDEEAVRVAKLMPDWIPGRQKGKNVRVTYTIPMVFKII